MFDTLTMRAVADELRRAVVGGRVQRLGLTDERTLILEIFHRGTRHQLLVSDHPQQARVHLVSGRLTADAARVTPFTLLLRKYVRGGRVEAVGHPDLERILTLSIVKVYPAVKDDAGDDPPLDATPGDPDPGDDPDASPDALPPGWLLARTVLHIEIMGRHSNAVLVDAHGAVIDALKRVPPSLSRVRPVLPHLPFAPPPPQEKADPRTITPAQLYRHLALAGGRTKLADALVGSLRGLSPQIAREVAYRATGDAAAPALPADAEAAVAALRDLFAPYDGGDGRDGGGSWRPVRFLREGAAVAFSPVPLRLFADDPAVTAEEDASISAVVTRFYAETGRAVAHGERRERLLRSVAEAASKLDTRLAALRGELRRAEELETVRRKGEAIYAAAHTLAPHATGFTTEDGLTVALDPALTPSENAQHYFEQYRKAQRAVEGVPERVAAAETERGYLAQLTALIETAAAFDDLQTLEHEWRDYTNGSPPAIHVQGKHGRGAKGGTGGKGKRPPAVRRAQAYTLPGGDRVLVGRSGPQNEHLTFTLSRPDDLWLHARGVGGAHVVVQWARADGQITPATLETAARLAAYYSNARAAGAVEVDYAPRRQVRKIAGAGPGMVTYRDERTVRVAPASVEELTAAGKLVGNRDGDGRGAR